MLTREENERLCRVGASAPMGSMMRRYWIPALMSEELRPGGSPKRVRLFGENLVAFRDAAGDVGLLDELCPHRGASLVLARNEDCALRCLYHGWKIDRAGTVLETPAEPAESVFRERVRAGAYAVRESGGIVWAYLGPAGHEPPPMDFDFAGLPETHRMVLKVRIACNWLAPVEGVVDSAHSNFLHGNTYKPTGSGAAASVYRDDLVVDRPSNDLRPRIEPQDMPYGFRYAAIRKPMVGADKNEYVRVTTFIAPIYAMFPAPAGFGNMQAFVPIDDENTMLYFIKYRYDGPIDANAREQHRMWSGLRPGVDVDADFHSRRNRENDWLQDRDAMEAGRSYSGIAGVQNEDLVVQESMGTIYDRSKEHLGASDVAVIRLRRLLLDALRRFADGEAPLGLGVAIDYANIRADERMVPIGASWQDACSAQSQRGLGVERIGGGAIR